MSMHASKLWCVLFSNGGQMMWILFAILFCGSLVYIIVLRKQIQAINSSLTMRLEKPIEQPITIELVDSSLNTLTKHINQLLFETQQTYIKSAREEKYYKELISNISHDFRTPLTAVKGYIQMLKNTEVTADQLSKLSIAEKHVSRLEQLLSIFFEYSYLLSNDIEPQKETVHVLPLIQETVAGLYTEIEQKGLEIELPESNERFTIEADEAMVVRIIQNLIRNSITHSYGHITIALKDSPNAVTIQFSNPIDLATYNESFDPNVFFDRFYTSDTTRVSNTGLGLSIVKLLSEKLGGKALATIKDDFITFHIELRKKPQP